MSALSNGPLILRFDDLLPTALETELVMGNARAEMRLPSLANMRKHWRALLKLRQAQRATGALLARQAFGPFSTKGFGAGWTFPIEVTLTRVGARKLDSDNLASAFKHVRDGIADYVGVDDGDERWTWKYDQRSGSKVYAVEAVFVVGRKA